MVGVSALQFELQKDQIVGLLVTNRGSKPYITCIRISPRFSKTFRISGSLPIPTRLNIIEIWPSGGCFIGKTNPEGGWWVYGSTLLVYQTLDKLICIGKYKPK